MLDDTYEEAEWKGDHVRVRVRRDDDGEVTQIWLSVRDDLGEHVMELSRQDVEATGDDMYEAFQNLQEQLEDSGQRFHCCGNCRYLQQTGMSAQMSDGGKGHCLAYYEEVGRSSDDAISIFGHCEQFEFGPKEFSQELQKQFEEWKNSEE